MTNTAPYIGLRPYTRDDSALFFGRDGDTQILLDKILANRLTLLFAASGVGKSSLLQAGIMLKLAGRGFYCNSWVDAPLTALKQAIVEELRVQGLLPATHEVLLALPLREFLRRYTVFCDDAPVLILDQMERGRAAGLLEHFFRRTVNALTLAEKRLASRAFDFLVNQRRESKS